MWRTSKLPILAESRKISTDVVRKRSSRPSSFRLEQQVLGKGETGFVLNRWASTEGERCSEAGAPGPGQARPCYAREIHGTREKDCRLSKRFTGE